MDTPLFAKYHDFLLWLLPAIEKFPRSQRFVLASRLLDTAYACHRELIRARKVAVPARSAVLLEADVLLDSLRLQVRLAHDLRCLSPAQYEHASRLLAELGRLLGAWRKSESSSRMRDSGAGPQGAVRLSQQEQP